jgi:NADH dehydrogenase
MGFFLFIYRAPFFFKECNIPSMAKRAVITGAFSFTGSAVAREMIRRGWSVHTLTNRTPPTDAKTLTSSPLKFDLQYLKKTIEGADLFINTYWVRLPWKNIGFQTAIDSTRLLVKAVQEAKVPRLVHVSVSNAEKGANLGYYRGKFELETLIAGCGISYAIVCPTLILGPNDVLANNIAWFLRYFPVFPVPQGGRYRLQPITLSDTARIIADAAESAENIKVDAAGPEIFTFYDYLLVLARNCGVNPALVSAPNWVALAGLRMVEPFLGDIVLTREELLSLKQELLISNHSPLGKESVIEWLEGNAAQLGRKYANDLKRHFGSDSTKPIISSNK